METLAFFIFGVVFFDLIKSGSVYGCVDFTCSSGYSRNLLPLGPAVIFLSLEKYIQLNLVELSINLDRPNVLLML